LLLITLVQSKAVNSVSTFLGIVFWFSVVWYASGKTQKKRQDSALPIEKKNDVKCPGCGRKISVDPIDI
jgi:hypothetical protein